MEATNRRGRGGRPRVRTGFSEGRAAEDLFLRAGTDRIVTASVRALAQAWGWTPATVGRFLLRLAHSGAVQRISWGEMRLTREFETVCGGLRHPAARRPVLRYHGGKWLLAPWIISHFPAHRVYVEPFGGAGSVLMRKPRAYAEVYNDMWGLVVNVFQVLRDPDGAARLAREMALTPYARAEFDRTGDEALLAVSDPVERARRTVLRSFAGFGSAATNARHATGFRANSARRSTIPAHDWANLPDNVVGFTERLQGVVIENRPAATVIRSHDALDALIYVDPPYPHATRNMERGNAAYVHEMSDDDHRALAEVLHSVRGMVVLSGYACELYDRELFADWARVERRAMADGARERTEVLWLNPAAAAASPSLAADSLTLFLASAPERRGVR